MIGLGWALRIAEAAIADLFWLSDEQWAIIGPFMPKNQPGARRVDDRRVISGIIHVLKTGGRWRDCPAEYGPYTITSPTDSATSSNACSAASKTLDGLLSPDPSP